MSFELDLSAVLGQRAQSLGEQTFLRLADGELSWRETDERAARLASVFHAMGYGTDSVVMAMGDNSCAQVLTWFACQKLGAVFAPINPQLSGEPLERILAHTGASIIVAGENHLQVVMTAMAGHDHLRHIIAESRLNQLIDDHPPWRRGAIPLDPDGRAKLMYTSGTTGDPKGVVWTRRCESIWAAAYATELLDVEQGEGIFTCLPLAHVTAQGTVLAAMQRGAVLTLANGFSPYSFWDQIRDANARRFTFVGTILAALAKVKPKATDRDHPVDRIVGAGAPIGQWRAIEDRFGVDIMETYGQTETAGCYTMPASLPQAPGSIGRPTARFEVRVDDPAGSELLLRPLSGGAIFDGYLQEDGSLESPYDDEGWYHTGDIVTERPDGDLGFVARERESIRRHGEIIASTPIEEAAMSHIAIREAAAVAVPSEDGTDEDIKLCVVIDHEDPPDLAELHNFLRDKLPRFMVPRYIERFASFPTTASTRIQKYKLGQNTDNAWDARHRRDHTTPAHRSK